MDFASNILALLAKPTLSKNEWHWYWRGTSQLGSYTTKPQSGLPRPPPPWKHQLSLLPDAHEALLVLDTRLGTTKRPASGMDWSTITHYISTNGTTWNATCLTQFGEILADIPPPFVYLTNTSILPSHNLSKLILIPCEPTMILPNCAHHQCAIHHTLASIP